MSENDVYKFVEIFERLISDLQNLLGTDIDNANSNIDVIGTLMTDMNDQDLIKRAIKVDDYLKSIGI